jgi:hypothetical protein
MPLHTKDTRKSGKGGGGSSGGKGKGKGKHGTSSSVKLERAMQKQTKVAVGDEEYEVLMKLLFDLRSSKARGNKTDNKTNASAVSTSSSIPSPSSSLCSSPLDVDSERAARYNEVKRQEKVARHEKKERQKLLDSLISDDKKSSASATSPTPPSPSTTHKGKGLANIFESSSSKLGKSVRLQVKAENSKGNAKVLVLPRSDNLTELFSTSKNKLKMKKQPISAYVQLLKMKKEDMKNDDNVVYLVDTLYVKDDTLVVVSHDLPSKLAANADDRSKVEEVHRSQTVEDEEEDSVVTISSTTPGTSEGAAEDCSREEEDDKEEDVVSINPPPPPSPPPSSVPSPAVTPPKVTAEMKLELGNKLQQYELSLSEGEGYQKMLVVRNSLPAAAKRNEFIEALESSLIVIIAGETG